MYKISILFYINNKFSLKYIYLSYFSQGGYILGNSSLRAFLRFYGVFIRIGSCKFGSNSSLIKFYFYIKEY